MTPLSHPLPGPWTLTFPEPATGHLRTLEVPVPGNIARALEKTGLVADATPPDRVDALREYEGVDDWTYRTEFDAPLLAEGERVRLVFEGIDTLADIRLNGAPLLRCENMFIPHAADVTDLLKPSGNLLEVVIRSLEKFARTFSYDSFQISRGNHAERQAQAYLRTARHLWGWDNAPRLLTGGIWRPVRLEVLPPIRFTEVYLYTQTILDGDVWIGCNWNIETPEFDLTDYHAVLRLESEGRVAHELPIEVTFVSGRNIWRLPLDSVRLWWPRGFGEPHLYQASLILFKGETPVARWSSRHGIRHMEFRMSDTVSAGGDGEFIFLCNGEKIYINGTNWKPLEAHHAEAPARMERALELAGDLHCNMIRIWGGGVYEDHDFFDWCDANGMLVWQDFMFACEFPPRDDFFREAVGREAEVIVKRLRNHPSLAIWCGDNEIDSMWFWDTLIPSELKPSDNIITREVLREAVMRHDPYRRYIPSSPYVADSVAALRWVPMAERPIWSPEDHLYPRDPFYRRAYRESPSLFLGETGPFFMNAISESPELLEPWQERVARIWDRPVDRKSYTIDRHQTDPHILTWMDCARKRLALFFHREFTYAPPDDFVLGLNVLCGDVFKYAIEFSRSRKWRKTGILWWSLIDMWPMAFNYSVVDYLWKKKKPYYWIRQSQQPVCLMAVESADEADPELFVANDTGRAESGRFRITALRADGSEQLLLEDRFAAPRNSTTPLGRLPFDPEPAMWVIEWEAGNGPCYNHYLCGRTPVDFEVYRRWILRLDELYGVEA